MTDTYNYDSPFRLQKEEYVRDIDVVEGYIDQTAHYIMTMTQDSYEDARSYVVGALAKGGDLEHTFPRCKLFVRNQQTGDRETKYTSIDKLFKLVIERDIISAPSLTFYLPEKVKRSLLSEFMVVNVAKRAVIKTEMFDAKAQGDLVLEINKNNEQNSVKTLNNGSSGAFSSPYTILYNQSSHSALTSTCRTATSYGNSANERLLSGTRHYWTHATAINHFLSVATLTDFKEFGEAMVLYGLHVPTVEETLAVIKRSTDLYCINSAADIRMAEFISKSKPLERAAFVYSGDMYHLAMYNDKFMRDYMGAMLQEAPHVNITDYKAAEKSIDGDMKIIISQIYPDLMGLGSNFRKVKEERPDDYKFLIEAAIFLQRTIGKYAKFVTAILTNKNVPPTIAKMPDAIRRVGVVSDTDSTMMAAQWWSKWYTGEYVGKAATAVADMMVYIAVQHMSHLMASMSVNMGVAKERIFLYSMKNEFKFASFSLTTKAKHYFALITSREGTIYSDPELEMKGVSLRTSNIPPIIMEEFRETVRQMSFDVANGVDIKIIPLMQRVADIESTVANVTLSGDPAYLKTIGVKDRSAYGEDRESNYHYHRMYNTIFGGKYGYLDEPPYDAVRLPVNLESKTNIQRWLDTIQDPEIKATATQWFVDHPKRTYKQIIIPAPVIENHGILKELLTTANTRRLIFATVEPYYHVLECLGVFMMDVNRTKLLSDYYGDIKFV